MLSIVFGNAFEVSNDEPDLEMARNYRANGRNFIGHDSTDIIHVCDEACAQTVIEEAGPYVECENDESRYVIVPDSAYDPSDFFRNVPTADVGEFDPGDDSYILCACGETLLRDDDKYEADYGHKIGES